MAEQTYISIVKSMKWSSLTIVLSATLGILLLFLSYCLPTKTISANVAESIGVFQNEGVYPLITGWGLPPLDNFTDARMLETAIYESGKDPLENALMGYSRRVDGTNPVDSLILLCGDNNSAEIYSVSVGDYARYWQGYLVPRSRPDLWCKRSHGSNPGIAKVPIAGTSRMLPLRWESVN